MLSLVEEKALYKQGYRFVAGIDEVGRGPLAGPVMAAAVVMPPRIRKSKWSDAVRDSKLLTSQQREELFEPIKEHAISYGIGMISVQTIDMHGIAKAVRLAMKQAVEQLSPSADFLLVDYFTIPELKLPQKGVVEGDGVCFSIACASILAKVARDRIMVEMDRVYRGYGFARHKGYGTREHLECLRKLGPCQIHRRSFSPVRECLPDDRP